MTLSDKLKLLRKEKKLTQEEASKKIGIALSSLRKYEQVGNPDVLQLKKIKEFYEVSYDYLLDNNYLTTKETLLNLNKIIKIAIDTVFSHTNFEVEELAQELYKQGYIEKEGNLYVYHKKCTRKEVDK